MSWAGHVPYGVYVADSGFRRTVSCLGRCQHDQTEERHGTSAS